jgi:hypothetical protein
MGVGGSGYIEYPLPPFSLYFTRFFARKNNDLRIFWTLDHHSLRSGNHARVNRAQHELASLGLSALVGGDWSQSDVEDFQ